MKIVISIKRQSDKGKREYLKRDTKVKILQDVDLYIGLLLDNYRVDINRKVTF